MKPYSPTPTIVPAKYTDHYQKASQRERARERYELYEKLICSRPTQELVGMIKKHRGQALFGEVLQDLLPKKSLPKDLKPVLGALNETSEMPVILLAITIAQAERFWRSLLGEDQKLFEYVRKELGKRKPDRQRSRGGAIDPKYDWYANRAHTVPQLAEALGVTSEGVKRMCRRKAIRIKPAPAAKRAGTISAAGAQRLLKVQLKRNINRRLGMKEQVEESRKRAAERKARIQAKSGDAEAPNIFSAPP
jgi:hypothetical protein